jgi:NitT/TauT family transport system permease protein
MASIALSAAATPAQAEQPPRRVAGSHSYLRPVLRLASILGCVLLWHLASTLKLDLGVVRFGNVPSPADTLGGLRAFLGTGDAGRHLLASLARVGQGFLLATLAGVPLGLLVGRFASVRDLAMPPLEIVRPIPAVAWIPLAILMLPTSEGSMVFITFLGAFFPILINTAHGVEDVDPRLIASARSLGAGTGALFREVIAPCALPSIVTGLVLGIGAAWFCLITAEMISGQFGIGYYTWASYTVQNYDGVVVGMIVIGLLGMLSSWLVRAFGRVLMPWRIVDGDGR